MHGKWIGLVAVVCAAAMVLTASEHVLGQEDQAKTAPAPTAPAAPQEPASSGGIGEFFYIIGKIGILILLLSVILVAMIVWLFLDLRQINAMPLDFISAFEDALGKRRFKEAFDLAREDGSMIARVLTAGMSRMQYGLHEARLAAEAMTDSLKTRKDHIIAYMAVLGTLGPLFGLVGTVYGMILSFAELGKGGTPNPGELAAGISHALYVTLLGISLSIPAIFFYSFFRNRVARIAIDVSLLADDLLTQVYHQSRRTGAEAGARPGPASAATSAPSGAPAQRPSA